ncbi:chitobiase/beta-hexosaminidase C-terminal domain-containing protein [Fibrobacterota bacterium]
MLFIQAAVSAQGSSDTAWLSVAYYDFHADGSNPAFMQTYCSQGKESGLLDSNLNQERKPLFNQQYAGSYDLRCIERVTEWYTPWPGGSDTSYLNMVFPDSLPFQLNASGLYEYTNSSFTPLDGMGFGNEGVGGGVRNFAFSMEIHSQFIYEGGEIFNFSGGQEVWVFIGGKLALDIEVSGQKVKSFSLDDLNLTIGQVYNFDFFFADRHNSNPKITITTSIGIFDPPQLTVQAVPGGRTFPSQEKVILMANIEGATIYYTLDGNDPSATSPVYTDTLSITETTTLKAFAVKTDWINSDTITEAYTKLPTSSRLEILDSNGLALPVNILYGAADKYAVKLSTNQAGSLSYEPVAITVSNRDTETLTMSTNTGSDAEYALIFRDVFDFNVINPTSNNDILEAFRYDTIIVSWTNPMDSNDVASDTVIVQPVDEQARIYFSTSDSLDDTTSQFSEGDSVIYIIITDQPADPSLTYTVTLTTTSAESETVTLTESGGNLVAQIPANYYPISADDDTLQVKLAGDVITASYTDPVYSDDDIKQGSAEYGAKSIADPVITPADGAFFQTDTAVTMSAATTGSSINYTLDGITTPSNTVGTPYAPFNVFLSTIVRAVAYIQNSADNYVLSNVVTVRLNSRDQIGIPTADPASTSFTESISIALLPDAAGDSIYYTLNGSIPDRTALLFNPASPIVLTVSDTIKFLAVNGPKIPSAVIQEIYIKRDTLDAPVILPPSQVFYGNITVTISNPMVTGAIIRYTTDGTPPNDSSAIFTPSSSLNFSLRTTVTARAFNPIGSDAYVPSAISSETFTPKVAAPVAEPSDTSFISLLLSRLSSATFGAQIYYTLDGSPPDQTKNLYDRAITVISTTTIKAIAIREEWEPSDVLEVTYTKIDTPSILEILDLRQQPLDSLTELNSSFTVVVTAAEANLNTISPFAVTPSNGDIDTLTLFAFGQQGEFYRFTAEIPFSVSPGNADSGNGTVEAGYYDSVIVTWINPNNPTDIVSDTVRVRPYPRPALMYFSESLTAGNPVFTYSTALDTIYLIVQDQVWRPGLTYTISLITDPTYGDRDPDTLTTDLREISPGVYGAAVPIEKSGTPVPGDLLLQALNADTISAFYTDPLDGESVTADIEYGSPGEVAGSIAFTDALGNELAEGVYWDPDEDSLYLRYTDDFVTDEKVLFITVKNTLGTGIVYYDTLIITLGEPARQDSIGIWTISVPMEETEVPGDSGAVEVFFKGEVTARISTHAGDGTVLQTIQDDLTVARPDQEAVILIGDCGGDETILRATEEICVTVIDQNFTNEVDTILVDVRDRLTSDIIQGLKLVQINDSTYSGSFTKDEVAVDVSDTVLSTLSADYIEVMYLDPVYSTAETKEVSFSDAVTQIIYFTDRSGGLRITNLNEYEASAFVVVVEASSPDKYEIDTFEVVITADGGDTVMVRVTETEANSGIFESADIPFGFSQAPQGDNQIIEGELDLSSNRNTATINAWVINSGNPSSSSLGIEAAYVPVDSAWIIDGDQDGRADTIFIKFSETLPELPANISSIDWPENAGQEYTAEYHSDEDLSEISFLIREDGSVDSSTVTVVLKDADEVFDLGATSASQTLPPKLTLPDNQVFQGLEIEIKDKAGAVIMEASGLSSDGGAYEQGGKTYLNPDTLIITLSESIYPLADTGTVWDSLLRFVSANSETGESYPVILLENTKPELVDGDSLQWMLIISTQRDVMKPRDGDYIFLSSSPLFSDASGNPPSEREVLFEKDSKAKFIYHTYLFSSVEGQDINSWGIISTLGEIHDGEVTMPNTEKNYVFGDDGEILGYDFERRWIQPMGLQEDGTIDMRAQQTCGPQDDDHEPVTFPENCLSTVVVWSDGPYTAYITIYDNLGKFVHSSVQGFGNCGELENPVRRNTSQEGVVSFLIWNQKDNKGAFVGSGVYVWVVTYVSPGKPDQEAIYRQGIARSTPPEESCAVNTGW